VQRARGVRSPQDRSGSAGSGPALGASKERKKRVSFTETGSIRTEGKPGSLSSGRISLLYDWQLLGVTVWGDRGFHCKNY